MHPAEAVTVVAAVMAMALLVCVDENPGIGRWEDKELTIVLHYSILLGRCAVDSVCLFKMLTSSNVRMSKG